MEGAQRRGCSLDTMGHLEAQATPAPVASLEEAESRERERAMLSTVLAKPSPWAGTPELSPQKERKKPQ